jgi:hypothetical protein
MGYTLLQSENESRAPLLLPPFRSPPPLLILGGRFVTLCLLLLFRKTLNSTLLIEPLRYTLLAFHPPRSRVVFRFYKWEDVIGIETGRPDHRA